MAREFEACGPELLAAAQRVKLLRAHGSSQKYVHQTLGTNSRLDPLQAALLRVRLGRLDEDNARRRRHATTSTG